MNAKIWKSSNVTLRDNYVKWKRSLIFSGVNSQQVRMTRIHIPAVKELLGYLSVLIINHSLLGFEEAMRKREHEFRVKSDEMCATVLAHEMKVNI